MSQGDRAVGDKKKLSGKNLELLPDADITSFPSPRATAFQPEIPSRTQHCKGRQYNGLNTRSMQAPPIESEEQLMTIARAVKKSGAHDSPRRPGES